jgi:hypothetical protein
VVTAQHGRLATAVGFLGELADVTAIDQTVNRQEGFCLVVARIDALVNATHDRRLHETYLFLSYK